jgi:hypothetical protein
MFGVDKFDIVIGNPPYVNVKNYSDIELKSLYSKLYKTATGQFDLFCLFTEMASNISRSIVSFIVPKPLVNSENYQVTRDILLDNGLHLIVTGSGVFNAGVESCIFLINKKTNKNTFNLFQYSNSAFLYKRECSIVDTKHLPFHMFSLGIDQNISYILKKIENKSKKLKDYLKDSEIVRGVECGKNDKSITYIPNGFKLIRGEDLYRYGLHFKDVYINFDSNDQKKFKTLALYKSPKILIRRVGNDITCSYDDQDHIVLNTIYCIPTTKKWLVGFINSKLISFWFKSVFLNDDKLFPYIRKNQLEILPIINFDEISEDAIYSLSGKVTQILNFKKENKDTDTTNLEKEIDQMVYELYGLTDEEIRIVEGK